MIYKVRANLKEDWVGCSETDVASYVMHSKDFEDSKKWTLRLELFVVVASATANGMKEERQVGDWGIGM